MTDFLTTRELASLLRVKERKVYDLVAAGALPVRRVTGKLLFPRDEIDVWLGAQSRHGGPNGVADGAPPVHGGPPLVFAGGHDPLCLNGRCANRVPESPRFSTAPSTG